MQHGETRTRHIRTGEPPALRDHLAPGADGLEPLRMEPPGVQQGLRPATFTSGLDELNVDALRKGAPVETWRGVGNVADLEAARRRATALDHE